MFKPRFWDYEEPGSDPTRRHFGYRRRWLMLVAFMTIFTLVPLLIVTLIDYRLTRHSFETEAKLEVERIVTNTWRSVSHALSQRRSALAFILQDNTYSQLLAPGRLDAVLIHLKGVMDGFVDLAVVVDHKRVQAYAGPGDATMNPAMDDNGFRQVTVNGFAISEAVSSDSKQEGRLIMALRQDRDEGGFFVLRSTLAVSIFDDLFSQLLIDEGEDVFIVDHRGVLQTRSRYHGNRFDRLSLPIPEAAAGTTVFEITDPEEGRLILGLAPISDSPFSLITVQRQIGILDLWRMPRMQLVGFLFINIVVILITILIAATYMVNRIHLADRRRVRALHQVAYANKLASIGRLASGVAHEVNNPLAIISQKAGLMKDLILLQRDRLDTERISGLVDDVLSSVQRCGAVTQRMLSFARHMESSIEAVNVEDVVREVLAFMEKEAKQRSIAVTVAIKGEIPTIECDRGNLQQSILNLVNNAMAAMEDGGRLNVAMGMRGSSEIFVTVADTGLGIPQEDLKRVFEPFFSTSSGAGGAGLGLPVTYGMVSQMGGKIKVQSKVNQGSAFTITLPLKRPGGSSANECPSRNG